MLPARSVSLWNALIVGYIDHGYGEEAVECFKQMQWEGVTPDVVTYVCSLRACGSIGAIDKGKQIHEQIVSRGLLKNHIVLGTALTDMYAKCGELGKAQEVFDELPFRDVVSWNSLMTGYARNGQAAEALNCFQKMQFIDHISPDAVSFIVALKACGSIGAIDKGKQIHDDISSKGFLRHDTILGTALVDMYAKCGALEKAKQVMENETFVQNVASWNALISGCVEHGQPKEALNCFKQMQHERFLPDEVTYLGVLTACSHSCFVEEGSLHFENMSKKHGLTPNNQHHTCMIDLFARTGRFDEAMMMIKKMPSSYYSPVWCALLSSCRKWGNWKLGRLAFEQAIHLDSNLAAAYVLMVNIYVTAGMHEDAAKVREALKSKIMRK